MDNVWQQYKLEVRKMLKNGDESHLSSARCVGVLSPRARLLVQNKVVLPFDVGFTALFELETNFELTTKLDKVSLLGIKHQEGVIVTDSLL